MILHRLRGDGTKTMCDIPLTYEMQQAGEAVKDLALVTCEACLENVRYRHSSGTGRRGLPYFTPEQWESIRRAA